MRHNHHGRRGNRLTHPRPIWIRNPIWIEKTEPPPLIDAALRRASSHETKTTQPTPSRTIPHQIDAELRGTRPPRPPGRRSPPPIHRPRPRANRARAVPEHTPRQGRCEGNREVRRRRRRSRDAPRARRRRRAGQASPPASYGSQRRGPLRCASGAAAAGRARVRARLGAALAYLSPLLPSRAALRCGARLAPSRPLARISIPRLACPPRVFSHPLPFSLDGLGVFSAAPRRPGLPHGRDRGRRDGPTCSDTGEERERRRAGPAGRETGRREDTTDTRCVGPTCRDTEGSCARCVACVRGWLAHGSRAARCNGRLSGPHPRRARMSVGCSRGGCGSGYAAG
jgi:hypothetical protein